MYFLQERGRKIKSKDISRRAHERIKKRTREDGLFTVDDGLTKNCFIQAHCFRRKSRSQTTNKKLFHSRERERGFEGEDDALG